MVSLIDRLCLTVDQHILTGTSLRGSLRNEHWFSKLPPRYSMRRPCFPSEMLRRLTSEIFSAHPSAENVGKIHFNFFSREHQQNNGAQASEITLFKR